jgi:hypothetical protein
VGIAVGQRQTPHALRVERGEDLGNAAAAVVSDQIDLIDGKRVEKLSQHMGIGRHGDVLVGRDLGVAMRQQINRDAPPDIRQPCHLVAPEMVVQQHAVEEQRNRT